MVFKVYENGMFSNLKQSEQSEQSSSNDKYVLLKVDNDLNTQSSDSDIPLFTPEKRNRT